MESNVFIQPYDQIPFNPFAVKRIVFLNRPTMQPIYKLQPGHGLISLNSYGSNAILSELASTYPLKLMSPSTIRNNVAVVYFLSYGGGLVGGDKIDLSVKVDTSTILVLRSQGSTKVFKIRPESRLAAIQAAPQIPSTENDVFPYSRLATRQTLTATVAANGSIFVLPDPVTCFRSASYGQKQTFHLSRNSSLLLIDWWTSGRSSMGEEWAFSRYHSINDVWIDGQRIAKDVMLLEEPPADNSLLHRSLADRLAPYSCYAFVILFGPLVQPVLEHLFCEYDKISVFKTSAPPEIIWSLSPLTSQGGAIVRVAGKETEAVKGWLGVALMGIQDTVGTDVYRSAFLS